MTALNNFNTSSDIQTKPKLLETDIQIKPKLLKTMQDYSE